jgi:hypothetical protein
VYPKRIKLFGNADFVLRRKINAFSLRAVAQGRIIDFNLGFHAFSAKSGQILSPNLTEVANPEIVKLGLRSFPEYLHKHCNVVVCNHLSGKTKKQPAAKAIIICQPGEYALV